MNKPLIIAHRGASADAPENTLASFHRARELGADGIELDVTLTRDRVPVVIHDDVVDRTTNGHGLVRGLTLLEIKQLDAGSWKSPAYQGETIPTLDQVLNAFAEWREDGANKRGWLINVELKSTTIRSDGIEGLVIDLIERRKLEKRILLSSFNPLALIRARLRNPRIARGLLYDRSQPIYLRRAWLAILAAPEALHPEHTMVEKEYMHRALRSHYQVNTWTVDSPEEAKRLCSLGVNAIITNVPEVIR